MMISGNEVPRPRQLRSRQASEELRAQLLTLQVVGHAVQRNNANMMHIREVSSALRSMYIPLCIGGHTFQQYASSGG